MDIHFRGHTRANDDYDCSATDDDHYPTDDVTPACLDRTFTAR